MPQTPVDISRAFALTGADAPLVEEETAAFRQTLNASSPADRKALRAAMARGSALDLLDACLGELTFGTGGCRGQVGLGPNRFNRDTLQRLVTAHAGWLLANRTGPEPCAVVIGWDTRRFHDVQGVYDPAHPPSCLGMSSEQFAAFAAGVYTACGVWVWWPKTGGTVGSLSFAIRQQKAAAGLYISASHNPPDHNGAKFYGPTGGQVVPPHDGQIAGHPAARTVRDEVLRLKTLPAGVREAWLEDLQDALGRPRLHGQHVVYSALHGAGARWIPRALEQAGARVTVVAEQHEPDGRFATVAGGQPNPENHAGLTQAMQLADRVGADLVMATDPDADRLGVACRGTAGWRVLNGNEIALVCTEAACQRASSGGVVYRTSVTASVISRLARARGMQVRDDARVGFKYLGVQMEEASCPFVVAVEESHGVLISDAMRDKDAVGAALLMALAAATEPPPDTLQRLEDELGAWATHLHSHALSGPRARQALAAKLAALRESPPTELVGSAIQSMEDGWAGDPPSSESERSSRNMLRFWLADGVVTLRPSGTEAKVKAYAECWRPPGAPMVDLARHARELALGAAAWLSDDAARTTR